MMTIVKRVMILVLLVSSANLWGQTQHYFKFAVPSNKTYDDKVSFKSADGEFIKNENGNYQTEVKAVKMSGTIYAVRNNQVFDSFNARNLYMAYAFKSDEQVFNGSVEGSTKTWESIKMLNNLRIEISDEGKVIKTYEVRRLTVVVSTKDNTRTKAFSFKSGESSLNLENHITDELQPGDLVILTGIKAANGDEELKTFPGYTIQINTLEGINKRLAMQEETLVTQTLKVYNTTTNEGYFLKGKVMEGNHATFNSVDLVNIENATEIAAVIKSANVSGMTGPWEIYLPSGQLYAKGTIEYSPELGTYTLRSDWKVEKEAVKTEE